MDKQVYLPDEFDEAAKDIPAGMHRMPIKRWHTLLPLLLILIFVPILAWGGVTLIQFIGISNQNVASQTKSSTPAPKQESTNKDEVAKKAEAEKAATEAAKKAAEEAAKKPVEVKKDLRIEVLNAGTKTGYAATTATQLKNAGFVNAAASRNKLPQGVNSAAVVYRSEEDKPTAQKIAETLNISDVRQNGSLTQGVMITVVVK